MTEGARAAGGQEASHDAADSRRSGTDNEEEEETLNIPFAEAAQQAATVRAPHRHMNQNKQRAETEELPAARREAAAVRDAASTGAADRTRD